MSNQNTAALAAAQILTYLGFAQAVSMEPGVDRRRDYIQALIESAMLSKLRAPVADERERGYAENAAFRIWWDENQACPEHSLTTENAAHAAWQERGRRAALARAPEAPTEVMDALNWVDDFIARCNRDDRGACDSVNVLRRALARAPVAGETVAWEEVRDALAILLSGATGKASKHWIAPLEDATASGPLAKMRACLAAPQARKAVPGCLLAAEHVGMTVDYTGLLGQARSALKRGENAPAMAEMLRQLAVHLTELGQRWYAGDAAVVDEFLQLYCVESEVRAALSTQPGAQKKGGSDGNQ